MKLFLITVLSLVSSVAMADGFRCQGTDFRVKLYNETQPERGTRNPAVLVVYERGVGTVATLMRDEITKTSGDESYVYEGQTNGRKDGRFVSVTLEISKTAETEGAYAGLHVGTLTVNANGHSRTGSVACERYLKRTQE